MDPPPTPGTLQQANVVFARAECPCGAPCYMLSDFVPIAHGAPLVCVRQHGSCPQLPSLIGQFDGSCRFPGTHYCATGAGFAIWRISEEGIQLLEQVALPLPELHTSAEAEAVAAASLLRSLQTIASDSPAATIELQGDNQSVIGYWNGDSRFSSVRLNDLLAEAKEVSITSLVHLRWAYIPPELNTVAEYLAGLASAQVVDARLTPGVVPCGPLHLQCDIITSPVQDNGAHLRDAIAQSGQGGRLLLLEAPDAIAWQYLPLARAAFPDKAAGALSLYAHAQFGSSGRPFQVEYQPAGGVQRGRLYSRSPGGQGLRKVFSNAPVRANTYGIRD